MYTINILIAEDEERLRKLIVKYLKNENYTIFEASNGQEALQVFEEESIDLVILDVMMPIIDGWTACREIRKKSDVPIVLLTARSAEEDKILGFELGVDDYVTKPFSTRELLARIKALLKRIGKTEAKEDFSVGKLVIHTPSRLVEVDGEEISLSPKEYDLLIYFTDNPNRALSREQILDRVWGYDFFGDGRTVDTVIKRLRKKLLDEGDRIQTVRSIGYRFEV